VSVPANPFVPQVNKPNCVKETHVAILLDRSGSMESCRDATISGFNEYVEHIRKTASEEGLDARITLTVFNHDVLVKHFAAPLAKLHRINRQTYVPDGNTAMLDAVGTTIDMLREDVKPSDDTTFLVCIVSDGYENASRRFGWADIAERIQRLTATDRWTFTYLGSNQDLSVVARELSIPAANTATYNASPEGTSHAWTRHSEASMRRMHQAAEGVSASQAFYEEEEEEPAP
jgi:uncharacterized protein YegL